MSNQKTWLLVLRIVTGWYFMWAGLNKIINPNWSASTYLLGAKNFTSFYHWLAGPSLIQGINFVNEWGLFLLGLSLIFGVGMRISSWLGAALMLLYYAAAFVLPTTSSSMFLVDQHILLIATLLFFGAYAKSNLSRVGDWLKRRGLPTWLL